MFRPMPLLTRSLRPTAAAVILLLLFIFAPVPAKAAAVDDKGAAHIKSMFEAILKQPQKKDAGESRSEEHTSELQSH